MHDVGYDDRSTRAHHQHQPRPPSRHHSRNCRGQLRRAPTPRPPHCTFSSPAAKEQVVSGLSLSAGCPAYAVCRASQTSRLAQVTLVQSRRDSSGYAQHTDSRAQAKFSASKAIEA
jgi:hypothetical protein